MRRRRVRPAVTQPTDEEYLRYLVAQLVAARIAQGIHPADVLSHIGYTYNDAPPKEKRGFDAEQWAMYKLALLERELHGSNGSESGFLSLFQRYARAVGVALRPYIVRRPRGRDVQRFRMRRVRRKGVNRLKARHSKGKARCR